MLVINNNNNNSLVNRTGNNTHKQESLARLITWSSLKTIHLVTFTVSLFQYDMAFRSINSSEWGFMMKPILKEIFIAEVNNTHVFRVIVYTEGWGLIKRMGVYLQQQIKLH